jgi:hypothetical protein
MPYGACRRDSAATAGGDGHRSRRGDALRSRYTGLNTGAMPIPLSAIVSTASPEPRVSVTLIGCPCRAWFLHDS